MTEIALTPRVLIVEDEEDSIRGLTEICRALGHDMTVVSSSKEAKEVLNVRNFDCILLDLQIPNEPGDLMPPASICARKDRAAASSDSCRQRGGSGATATA